MHQHASLVITQMTAQPAMAALHTAIAMTAPHAATLVTAIHVPHTATAMTAHASVVQMTAAASAQPVVCQTAHGKTATNHAATLLPAMTAVHAAISQMTVAHAVVSLKTATQTAQTVLHEMTLASQPSAARATPTQTRRHSSKTRFLSV